MTGTLIDGNENQDILTGEELAVLQAALGTFRKKRFEEDRRAAMKLKEIEVRERLKMEKEGAKAARAKEELVERACLRAERDTKRAAEQEAARVARVRARQLRDAERTAVREDDNDAKAAKLLKKNQELGSGPFANWEPGKMLEAIVETMVGEDPAGVIVIGSRGSPFEMFAIAIDHPAIMKKLDCPAGYHLVLRQHPQMIDTSRAVWFGDRLERCIVFSLPFVGGGNA